MNFQAPTFSRNELLSTLPAAEAWGGGGDDELTKILGQARSGPASLGSFRAYPSL